MSLRDSENESTLLQAAAAFAAMPSLKEVAESNLAALAQERGIDFATALLYDRVRKSARCLSRDHPYAASSVAPLEWNALRWAIAPGAFHREPNGTGADGAELQRAAERLGIPCEVVPLESFGSVARNADILANWLAERSDQSFVLISLSKASLEVRRLLERADADAVLGAVRIWINLSGIVSGSPLVQWLVQRPIRWLGVRALLRLRGYDVQLAHELNRTPQLTQRAISLPRGMRAVHVLGFPLQCHLSSALMRRGHRRLAGHGPNDGGIVLSDAISWPGWIYPVWGADHYLRTPETDTAGCVTRVLALLGAATARQPLLAD